jgi:hypothetical protein
MTKAAYDTNNDGIVDHAALADTATTANAAPWTGITSKPATFAPSSHAPSHNLGGGDAISPDWTQVQNKPGQFSPSPHHASHVTGGSDIIAPASVSAVGLLNQLSGNTTDFLDGTNSFHDLGATILGQSAITNAGLTKSIIVPRFASHPDALWTYNAFDDHFDGSALNAKWTNVNTAGSAGKQTVVGGSFVLQEVQAAASGTFYNTIWQSLPAGTAYDVRCHIRGLAYNSTLANMSGGWCLNLCRSQTAGVQIAFNATATGTSPASNYLQLIVLAGTTFGTVILNTSGVGSVPEYFRIQYLASKVTNVFFSLDGTNWCLGATVAAAQSGFNTTPPSLVQLSAVASTGSDVQLNSDWIKLIYS